ncbi:MAG TPA: type III polyketide synthase [Gemmataceae bacterium]|nr:type III polyketide synthase [Gemmataceae bacterium]
MSLALLGIGTALPATAITQAEAVRIAEAICCRTEEQADLLPALYRQSGIRSRHLAFSQEIMADVLHGTRHSGSVFLPQDHEDAPGPTTSQRMQHYAEEAGPLAVEAARRALREAAVDPRSLSHLVTVSCTGFRAPGVDVELIKGLELKPTIERTHVGFMGCHGALNGLRVARAFTGARPGARVLLSAVELCGLHYEYRWNPKKMVSNALFADGAAALVGVSPEDAPADAWQAVASGACLFPASESAMTWSIGDHGFEMTLSTRVPDLLARHVRPWLEEWLEECGLRLGDIASWAIHPGGPRILTAVEQALGLGPDATAVSREVLAECGNMSSPTILFVLRHLRDRGAPLPCVALGFGPGLATEAAIFDSQANRRTAQLR